MTVRPLRLVSIEKAFNVMAGKYNMVGLSSSRRRLNQRSDCFEVMAK